MKQYPAGRIHHSAGWVDDGEAIEMQDNGILYFREGHMDNTLFVPYARIDMIVYDKIPQEILDKAQKMQEVHDAR